MSSTIWFAAIDVNLSWMSMAKKALVLRLNENGAPSSAMSTSFILQIRDEKHSRGRVLNDAFPEERRRNYEETFGNISSFETMFQRVKDDPEDIKEYQRERNCKSKSLFQYIKDIKSHLDNSDYESAVKVLEIDMINDKIPVSGYAYKILMSYNAKIGDLAEAYRLYVNYKKRQGLVTGAMYTSLFNACANCKNSLFALEKAAALNESIRNNKNHVINLTNYNSMIKAYGRHGDMVSCLKIMDEVLDKRDKVKSSSFLFLLQACISDRNSGLRHALLLWRKMIQNRVKPSIFSFRLMLRCLRDCSLGDIRLIPNLVEEILKESEVFYKRKVHFKKVNNETVRIVTKVPSVREDFITPVEYEHFKQDKTVKCCTIEVEDSKESDEPFLENREVLNNRPLTEEVKHLNNQNNQLVLKENAYDSSESLETSSNMDSSLMKVEPSRNNVESNMLSEESELPNLLALRPSRGSVIEFGIMTKPEFRFLLVGGIRGFLRTMAEFGVSPDIRIFTLMLDLTPSTLEAEQDLLSLMKTHKVRLDTTFFNVLLKRRFLRDEDSSARDCLEEMHKLSLPPDLVTFGILALGCRTYESGMDLLWNVKNHGYRVNSEILGALLLKAKHARDMKYAFAIVQYAKENDIKLSQKFIAELSHLIKREQYLRKKEGKYSIENEPKL